jgi:hypothetical protein
MHRERETLGLDRVAGFDLVDEWERSRSGTRFYRFRVDPDGREVLVKTGDDWTAADAERLSQAQASLADAISYAGVPDADVIRPHGWVPTPPLLVMPYVEATDLVSLLRQPDRPEWTSMHKWIRAAGAMLAAFHRANRPVSADDVPASLDEVTETARKMRLRGDLVAGLLEEADWRSHCYGAYGDFGPGNLLGEPGGTVHLIDPPVEARLAPFHRDLGNFLFEMRRQLAGHGYTRSKPVRGRFDDLRKSLLEGYVGTSLVERLRPADRALISLYEMRRAAGMARRRNLRSPGDAIWFAGSAWARRREVKRLAVQPE